MATKPTTPKSPKNPGRPRAANARAAKPRPGAAAKEPGDAAAGPAKAAMAGLRLKELVDKVTAGTDVKKKDVRTVVEATLALMGESLKKGESLNLVGFGRMRVARPGTEAGGAMTLKLRTGAPGPKGKKADTEPLAEAEDQD